MPCMHKMQTTDYRLGLKCRQGTKYRLQTVSCDIRYIYHKFTDIFTINKVITLMHYSKVTQCWSGNIFHANFLLGLFHSKNSIVTIENLSKINLFFNRKQKRLVIKLPHCKGNSNKSLDHCWLSYDWNKDMSPVALHTRASTFRCSALAGFLLIRLR